MSTTPASFRTWQAISDLRHAAIAVPPAVWHRMPRDLPGRPPETPGFVAALWQILMRGGRIGPVGGGIDLHEILSLVAARPEADVAAFRAATILLLADALQAGRGSDAFVDYWDAFAADYAAAPGAVRAAIVNGFARLSEMGPPLDPPPDPADRLTRTARLVLPPLLATARGMRGRVRDRVVEGDAGRRAELDRVLSGDGLIPTDLDWSPLAAVERASLAFEAPGFVGCGALLLINAIRQGDLVGWFDHRWEAVGAAYVGLPPMPRRAILAGIRHLYESDPTFLEAADLDYDPEGAGDGQGILIPVV